MFRLFMYQREIYNKAPINQFFITYKKYSAGLPVVFCRGLITFGPHVKTAIRIFYRTQSVYISHNKVTGTGTENLVLVRSNIEKLRHQHNPARNSARIALSSNIDQFIHSFIHSFNQSTNQPFITLR